MTTIPNAPAFPLSVTNANGEAQFDTGLTKREYFAAKALQGIVAYPNSVGFYSDCAEDAVKHADALLAELSNPEGNPSLLEKLERLEAKISALNKTIETANANECAPNCIF